jgi:hypothetical protein
MREGFFVVGAWALAKGPLRAQIPTQAALRLSLNHRTAFTSARLLHSGVAIRNCL